jgi:hypothetical protein
MIREDIALVLERAAGWPEDAQLKPLQAALEIEQEQGVYRLSDAERADLQDAEGEFLRGEVASASQIAETFERLRGK